MSSFTTLGQGTVDSNVAVMEYGAVRLVFNIYELVEMILLKTGLKTTLLSQRVSKVFKNVIADSTKLQKKLFFIRPSFEEAIKLSNNKDDLVTSTHHPKQAAVLNTLLTDFKKDFQLGKGCRSIRARIPKAVVNEMHLSVGGSWRRMWLASHLIATDRTCEADIDVELTVTHVVSPHHKLHKIKEGQRTQGGLRPWGLERMQGLLSHIESRVLHTGRVKFEWSATYFIIRGSLMTHVQWRGLSWIAAKEGVGILVRPQMLAQLVEDGGD